MRGRSRILADYRIPVEELLKGNDFLHHELVIKLLGEIYLKLDPPKREELNSIIYHEELGEFFRTGIATKLTSILTKLRNNCIAAQHKENKKWVHYTRWTLHLRGLQARSKAKHARKAVIKTSDFMDEVAKEFDIPKKIIRDRYIREKDFPILNFAEYLKS